MRMRDDDAAQVGKLVLDETGVRQDQVDARMGGIRKGDTDIDDDPFAVVGGAVAIEGEVHADFADTAQRHEHEFGVIRFRHPVSPFVPSCA